MNRFHPLRRFDGATLVAGLFLLVLMAGCVNVNTSCGSCCGKDGGLGDGACNPYPPSGSYTGPASPNFYDTTTSQLYTGGGNCTSGKRCNPNTPPGYGRCASGATCKNWITPATGVCKCDCNP